MRLAKITEQIASQVGVPDGLGSSIGAKVESAAAQLQNAYEASAAKRSQAAADMARKQEFLAMEEARIAEVVRNMPITSGHNFEGYHIVRYGGYVSGDEVASISRTFFTGRITNDSVNDAIKGVRNVAIEELKQAAANIDCNAVIGLDFDYITLEESGREYPDVKIILTANGTAVTIVPD